MNHRTGILLAAHGSRLEPAANARVAALAAALEARGAADEVVAGFHQGDPGYSAALQGFTASRMLVLPLFTSEGYYTSQVLPAAILAGRGRRVVQVRQTRPVGVEPGLVGIIVDRIRRLTRERSLDSTALSLLLVGHGTRRHADSRQSTRMLAGALEAESVAAEVRCGFLDDEPAVEKAAAGLNHPTVLVLPFLIGGGSHAMRDLPRRLGLGDADEGVSDGRRIILDRPVGDDEALIDLLEAVARRELPALSASTTLAPGSVALVGAGPGDPGLITVRGLSLLRGAEVVLHDRLSAPELLLEARRDALVIDVGKLPGGGGASQAAINALIVEHALKGRRVVRLKGGDPFVFGRGSEEADACAALGIPCTVVPGITSAIAVPGAAGIPVTARGESRSFAVVSAQSESGDRPGSAAALAANPGIETLVLLMGRSALRELADELIAAGRDPETPVACIQEGTTPRQRVTTGTLASIAEAADRDGLTAPIVIVVGQVAARAVAASAPC